MTSDESWYAGWSGSNWTTYIRPSGAGHPDSAMGGWPVWCSILLKEAEADRPYHVVMVESTGPGEDYDHRFIHSTHRYEHDADYAAEMLGWDERLDLTVYVVRVEVGL